MESESNRVRLIAHRGGVVNSRRLENSVEALKGAIEERYWMVEIDVRPTRDHVPVVHHDPEYQGTDGASHVIAETDYSTLRKNAQRIILRLEDYVGYTTRQIGLMINFKDNNSSDGYFDTVTDILEEAGGLESTYIIGVPRGKERYTGQARVSINPRHLDSKEDYVRAAGTGRFMFGHGRAMPDDQVQTAREAGLEVVPSVNEYHYWEQGQDPVTRGRVDIERLLAAEVRTFQIDSGYRDVFGEYECVAW